MHHQRWPVPARTRRSVLELPDSTPDHILPFDHELAARFREEGENSALKEDFMNAYGLAQERETEENDGLPSEALAIQNVPVIARTRRLTSKSNYLMRLFIQDWLVCERKVTYAFH
jgi:hypothetical protein